MKRVILFALVLTFMVCQSVTGQNKVNNTIDKVEKTANTADQVGKTFNKIKGVFGGKKDKDGKKAKDTVAVTPKVTDVAESAVKTLITISGIDYAKLKALNENIRNCKGVQSSKMVYDIAGSQIEVAHSGSTEDLIKIVSEISKDIFSEKNIASLGDGKVALKF